MEGVVRFRPIDRGIKRRADDTLTDEARFAKRFSILNLDTNSLSQSSLSSPSSISSPLSPILPSPTTVIDYASPDNSVSDSFRQVSTSTDMNIDDTPHRIFISDLDAELASIVDEECHHNDDNEMTVHTDVIKKLSQIQKERFMNRQVTPRSKTSRGQELILYRPVTSVPFYSPTDMTNDGKRKEENEGSDFTWKRKVLETAHGLTEREYNLLDGHTIPTSKIYNSNVMVHGDNKGKAYDSYDNDDNNDDVMDTT